MSRQLHLDELQARRDKPAVFAWLRSYLRWHIGTWSRAYGLGWSDRDIDAHIDERDLVNRHWDELISAQHDDAQLVTVAREASRPIGIIHIEERVDRFLELTVGVLSWLFVEPVSRGTGVSTTLIHAAGEWMRERELVGAEVFVTADNPAAVKAYRRGGYEIVDYRMLVKLGG